MHISVRSAGRWLQGQGKVIAAVAVGVAIGGFGPAVVRAAIPDTSGQIHACYTNSSSVFNAKGTVQVINSANTANCPSGTTSLNWDQHGGSAPKIGDLVANLANGSWNGTSMAHRNFSGADLHGSSFTQIFDGVDFHNANMSGSSFDLANLNSSNNMQNVNLSNSTLYESSFKGADLTTANLTGVIWNVVTCPDGTQSYDHGDTCIGHLAP